MKWLVISVFLAVSINAHAYLDPGTGSMLLQVILGGVAAIGVAILPESSSYYLSTTLGKLTKGHQRFANAYRLTLSLFLVYS